MDQMGDYDPYDKKFYTPYRGCARPGSRKPSFRDLDVNAWEISQQRLYQWRKFWVAGRICETAGVMTLRGRLAGSGCQPQSQAGEVTTETRSCLLCGNRAMSCKFDRLN